MKTNLLLMAIALMLMSCSSPVNNKYSDENFMIDAAEIKKSGDIDKEDLTLMGSWILKSKMKGISLADKTYADIIEDAKSYQAEQLALAEKTKLEEEAKRQRFSASLTVAMFDKGFTKADYQSYLTYGFVFENKTNKDIRAFKGSVSIQDLFDTEISVINLTIDSPIKAKSTFKGNYTTEYNDFRAKDVKLKSKTLEDLKIVWTPEKILFVDGTSIE